jgi:hypothetical protein
VASALWGCRITMDQRPLCRVGGEGPEEVGARAGDVGGAPMGWVDEGRQRLRVRV